MKQPSWYTVELGPAAEQSLRGAFAAERSAVGWPSITDVIDLWLPEAKVVVTQSWESSAQIVESALEDVRAVVMKEYLSIFPPASLAVYRAQANDASLVIIGVSFDRDLWELKRIEGLND